jgi:hypothetical protein
LRNGRGCCVAVNPETQNPGAFSIADNPVNAATLSFPYSLNPCNAPLSAILEPWRSQRFLWRFGRISVKSRGELKPGQAFWQPPLTAGKRLEVRLGNGGRATINSHPGGNLNVANRHSITTFHKMSARGDVNDGSPNHKNRYVRVGCSRSPPASCSKFLGSRRIGREAFWCIDLEITPGLWVVRSPFISFPH